MSPTPVTMPTILSNSFIDREIQKYQKAEN